MCSSPSFVLYSPSHSFSLRLPSYQPGPAQGFSLLKASFSCHCCLFGAKHWILWATVAVTDVISIKLN